MSDINALTLTQKAWEEISHHAVETFPEECCGVILHNGGIDAVRRCRNIQNALHALDPESYPRDATIAYKIEERKVPEPIVIIHQFSAVCSAVKIKKLHQLFLNPLHIFIQGFIVKQVALS